MKKLYDFWILITTPGTQLPSSTTIIVLLVIAACAFLLPSFVKWRAYRRESQNQINTNNTKKSKSSYANNKKKKYK